MGGLLKDGQLWEENGVNQIVIRPSPIWMGGTAFDVSHSDQSQKMIHKAMMHFPNTQSWSGSD